MDYFAEEVYYSLQGESLVPVPGVENAFEDGKNRMYWYRDMMAAYGQRFSPQ